MNEWMNKWMKDRMNVLGAVGEYECMLYKLHWWSSSSFLHRRACFRFDVSEERNASIFRVAELVEAAASLCCPNIYRDRFGTRGCPCTNSVTLNVDEEQGTKTTRQTVQKLYPRLSSKPVYQPTTTFWQTDTIIGRDTTRCNHRAAFPSEYKIVELLRCHFV